MEDQTERKRSQVVLVPCPFQGHLNPMLQLGTFLQSRGFSITVVHTCFNPPNPSNHPGFRFQAIPDYLPEDANSLSLAEVVTLLYLNCQTPFKQWLVQMTEEEERDAGDEGSVCVIYDELMYFAEAAAKEVKAQSIILRTTSAAAAISRFALIQLEAETHIPLQDPASQEPVPGLDPLRFKDLPIPTPGLTEDFLQLVSDIYDIRTSSGIIWNTTDCLEHSSLEQLRRQCKVPIFPIGPLHKTAPTTLCSLFKEDTSCIKWLNKQADNSVIYISFGSIASMDDKELVEMAWGLANSKQPFLWVVRPKKDSEPIELFLPDGFIEAVGENGCLVKWAPQKEVLAHSAVGGFWTHCGWNSTLESISEGVPMICSQCFEDQKVNSRYVSFVWRVGLEFDNVFERGEIEKAVEWLMVDEEGKEMRQRAMDLKEKVELSIRESGSSYDSLDDLSEFIKSFKLQG